MRLHKNPLSDGHWLPSVMSAPIRLAAVVPVRDARSPAWRGPLPRIRPSLLLCSVCLWPHPPDPPPARLPSLLEPHQITPAADAHRGLPTRTPSLHLPSLLRVSGHAHLLTHPSAQTTARGCPSAKPTPRNPAKSSSVPAPPCPGALTTPRGPPGGHQAQGHSHGPAWLPALWSNSSPTAVKVSKVTMLHEVASILADGLSPEPPKP